MAAALGVAFNLRDENVAADILARSNRLRGVVDTTWHKVQEAIIDAEAKGETIDGIAKKIGQVFAQGKGYRARVIARTETVGAMNSGSLQAATQSGVVEKKVWLAARDHRTRSSHLTADGQAVPTKGKFAVGAARMDHPGDPSGGASEVVNCRCTMLFKRNQEADIVAAEVDNLDPADAHLVPSKDEKLATMRKQAADLRTRNHHSYPLDRKGFIEANARREADLRDLGRQVREEAMNRVGKIDPTAIEKQVEELTAKARALMDEQWNMRPGMFGRGLDHTGAEFRYQIKEGEDRYDAYKKLKAALRKERDAVVEARNRVQTTVAEARGKAVREVLADLREMGVDPKRIKFETGSATAGKEAVKEMAQWYPAEWWDNVLDSALDKIQVKLVDRGYYSANYAEKVKGAYRYVQRIATSTRAGDYRSTTVHELGHLMEHNQQDVTNLELRFWRRRTGDGNGFGGMRTYRYGRSDEIVNPDEFGDEYMGKSYLARHSTDLRERGKYIPEKLDILEGDRATKTTAFEILSMGMEELVFNQFGSWENDLDYLDFIIGILAGV